jgi:hypothetical protein
MQPAGPALQAAFVMPGPPRLPRGTNALLGLSATSQQYFCLRTNQPSATSQQYFSLRINQHQPSATSQTNRLQDQARPARRQRSGDTPTPPVLISSDEPPADVAASPLHRRQHHAASPAVRNRPSRRLPARHAPNRPATRRNATPTLRTLSSSQQPSPATGPPRLTACSPLARLAPPSLFSHFFPGPGGTEHTHARANNHHTRKHLAAIRSSPSHKDGSALPRAR